jgi:hypothetical protein
MKLDEKRQVIEMLLCAGSSPWSPLLFRVAIELDADNRPAYSAAFGPEIDALYRTFSESNEDAYGSQCLEAAYRPIESSPTLRREWFGP